MVLLATAAAQPRPIPVIAGDDWRAVNHGAAGTPDGRSTSVGIAAIPRFLRPIVYQNMAPQLLPLALRNDNPPHIPCRRDGVPEAPPARD